MPVGVNQWKARDAAAKAAGTPPTEAQPTPPTQDASSSSASRKGRLQNFRTKSTEGKDSPSAKDAAAAEATAAAAAAEQQSQQNKSKSVAGKWQASQDDQKVVRKKRLEVTEAGDDSRRIMVDPANVGIIIENEPVRLEGVVRSDDPSEFQKPLELEKGWAKNMASRFQNIGSDDQSEGKKSFQMDVEIGAEPEVHENEPVRLEGVVRASDRTEDVIGKRGTIKNIAGRFASGAMAASEGNNNGDAAPPPTSGPNRRSVLDRFQRGPIDSDGSVVLSENVPTELDPNVVRSSADGYRANDPVMEAGKIRNIAGRFLMQKTSVDEDDEDDRQKSSSKPAWLIELEKAKEAETRIIENEPEVRDDVVRADDDIPDIISVQHTRSLRQMWTQIEKDKEAAEKQPKNRPLPPIAKPKEPSPEPEPPKPPPEEPKPKYGAGRRTVGKLQLGQLQKEEPPKPAAVGKAGPVGSAAAVGGRQQAGSGGKVGATAAVAPAAAPAAEVDSKRPFSKPSLKPIQASKK